MKNAQLTFALILVKVLVINASSILIHHTIALHEHYAFQTSLHPLKDKGG